MGRCEHEVVRRGSVGRCVRCGARVTLPVGEPVPCPYCDEDKERGATCEGCGLSEREARIAARSEGL